MVVVVVRDSAEGQLATSVQVFRKHTTSPASDTGDFLACLVMCFRRQWQFTHLGRKRTAEQKYFVGICALVIIKTVYAINKDVW